MPAFVVAFMVAFAVAPSAFFACASAAEPRPSGCKSCGRPGWGWDTVGHMSFTHTCNVSGPWSEEALDVLQKFQIVNIERFMNQHQSCFAKHRAQWGGESCWLDVTGGTPGCDTFLDRGNATGHR